MAAQKTRTPSRPLIGAAGALVLAWAAVPVLEWLLDQSLPLWLHIPLAGLVLSVLGGGALAAGALWVEYRLARGKRI